MMHVLLACGKFQYGDSSRGLGTEYTAFTRALRELGHDVTHFELWDRGAYQDFRALNLALVDAVDAVKPDILLAVPLHYEIWNETLYRIRGKENVVTICWTTDDSWKYREVSRFVGKAYDVMTTTYPDIVCRYRADGIQNVALTQWAADSGCMQAPIPAGECVYGVSFVGTAHGSRPRVVAKLRKAGVDIHCFGYGWPRGPVEAGEIPRIIRNSVISLNFSNSKGEKQIKARTFEIPGAGGFLLTEFVPGLERFYRPGREAAVFRDMRDLVAKIRYYLQHPKERDAVAEAGFLRTRRDHTYERRLKEVLDFALRAGKGQEDSMPLSLADLDFRKAAAAYSANRYQLWAAKMLERGCGIVWGPKRGVRAARRIAYELSWRFMRGKTYTASGWPGKMFPKA